MGGNEKVTSTKRAEIRVLWSFRDRSEIDKEEKNMGKYKGLFWPAILGVKHMPKVKESEFYNVAGGFRRATINDKIAFFLQHPVWEAGRSFL